MVVSKLNNRIRIGIFISIPCLLERRTVPSHQREVNEMIEEDFQSLLAAGLTVSEACSNHDGRCRDAYSKMSANEPVGYVMQMDYSINRPILKKGETTLKEQQITPVKDRAR